MYQRVVVTVKRKDEARVRDLEVPVNIDASRLAEMIARALRWESDMAGQRIMYVIEAHPLGRILQPDETLASAGVWDGSWLVLHPIQPPATQQPEGAPQAPAVQPVPQPEITQPMQAAPAVPQKPAAPSYPSPEPAMPTPVGEWTFPVAQAPAGPAEPEFAPEPPPPADDSLLEMLLTGEQPASAPETTVQPPAQQAPAAGNMPAQPGRSNFPAAPEPVQAVEPAPQPEVQAPPIQPEQTPTRAAAEDWTLPAAATPGFMQPATPLEPEPQTAPEPAAWSFQPEELTRATPAEAEPEPAEPSGTSLLEMLLGGAPPQTPEPEPEQIVPFSYAPAAEQEQPAAPAWTAPPAEVPPVVEAEPEPEPVQARADEWNFPVAEPHHLEAVLQAQAEAETAPRPEPAEAATWTFPIAPLTPEPEPEGTTAEAPEQEDHSLLEMLLGGAPAPAAQPQAPEPQVEPEQAPVAKVPAAPEPPAEQAAAAASTSTSTSTPATPVDQQVPPPLSPAQPKIGGFRSLGIELPPETEPAPEEKKPRFVWKKLDD